MMEGASTATTVTVDRTLGAGYHSVRMEYFEAGGDAVAQLSWTKIGDTSSGAWRGEYFNNASLSGSPTVVRDEADINFNWGYGTPAAEIPVDNFSARWTRTLSFAAGTYTFTATVDDGVRVKVDGAMVIDHWADGAATAYSGDITLSAGTHTVVMEYYEHGGVAQARLTWAAKSTPGSRVTVVVDDLDSGFALGGNPGNFHERAFGYRNHMWWLWNNTTAAYSWATWTPRLPAAGTYEVQVYIPSRNAGTASARYRIFHNGTRHDRVVAQANYYDQWVSLGSYYFTARGGEYVFLASNTGEPYATHYVGFDAVRFIGTVAAPPPVTPPTPVPPACSIMPVLGFGNAWNSDAQVRACLGCPTAQEQSVWMAEESFVGGTMFWRSDNNVIYVLFSDGTWRQFPDPWHAGDAEIDSSITPPAGQFQPRRGFGKLWRDNPQVRAQTSWATTEEQGFYGSLQPFQNGLMLWSPRLGVYSLCNDGRWKHF